MAQVRWQDGSQERLPVVRLQKVQESLMRDQARKLIQEVAAGASPRAVVEAATEAAPLTVVDKGRTLLAKDVKGYGLMAWQFPNRASADQAAKAHGGDVVLGSGGKGFYVQVQKNEVKEDVPPDMPPGLGRLGAGEHPGAEIPPNAEDPSDSYKTSFDDGGNGPHAHVVTLDPQGNGLTDEEMGSQHQVLRFQVQPDPLDGHLHTLDLGVNRGVPSSRNSAGQPTTYHATSDDPHRSEGY